MIIKLHKGHVSAQCSGKNLEDQGPSKIWMQHRDFDSISGHLRQSQES